VIAIMSLLITLLLPAVQSAREAGRLTQCRSNLRQIGLAFQNHESTHGRFPSNGWDYHWLGEPDRGTGRDQPGGWIYNILDYIDRSDLRILGSSTDPRIRLQEQQQLFSTVLPLFVCPSRPSANPGPVDDTVVLVNSQYPSVAAKNDYAVNAGSRRYGTCYGNAPLHPIESSDQFPWALNPGICTGVVFQRSEIRYRDIVDGTTVTLLAGEKAVPAFAYNSAINRGFDASMYVGQCMDLQRRVNFPPLHDLSTMHDLITFDSSFFPWWSSAGSSSYFGSAHNSGCPMVFCDGHVRIISFYIDRWLFEHLGDRSDGNAVGDF
jgi:prepilin-type processing-associated H-X9-DG protein